MGLREHKAGFGVLVWTLAETLKLIELLEILAGHQ
jgi:hypothetical protein